MLDAVAIVPAYNEAPRIARVIAPLVASRLFARVLVVDDGSRDGTTEVAARAGADVLPLRVNRGKGGAMREGVAATVEPVVCFFDADLVGLVPPLVAELLAPVVDGDAGMCVGRMDYGVYNELQSALPLISGQRAIRREILSRIPSEFWSGFRIEAALNEAAARSGWPVETVILRGVEQVPKWHKTGVRRGISDGAKMMIEVLRAVRDARTQVR